MQGFVNFDSLRVPARAGVLGQVSPKQTLR